jgi:hypothetical protein
MTLVLRGANRMRYEPHGHSWTIFRFLPVVRFPATNLAPGSLQSDDRQLGGPEHPFGLALG